MSQWNKFLTGTNRSLFSQAHTHRIYIERIMLEVPKSGSVLEAGCGMANLSRLLADAGYKMTAGDIDDEVLISASQGYQSSINKINFVKLDLLNLKSQFESNAFDAIIHSGVMEHFSDEDIIRSFKEQRAVAKCVIFKIPNNRTKMTSGHFGDERFMTNDQWIRLIKQGGFDKVRVFGGESSPGWTHLMPSLFHMYPKIASSSKRNALLEGFSLWRKYLSKHSIFVCYQGSV